MQKIQRALANRSGYVFDMKNNWAMCNARFSHKIVVAKETTNKAKESLTLGTYSFILIKVPHLLHSFLVFFFNE